jgi:dTDP-glucose pyrophosphorylase
MNILILAAGGASNNEFPLYLTEFNGEPLMQRTVGLCQSLSPARIVFALREEDVRKYHLDSIIKLLAPSAVVQSVHGETRGAACTALLASSVIDNQEELLILNGNELLEENFDSIVQGFRARGLDAGAVAFNSVHPRYSYVRLDAHGLVVEAREKKPISRNAVAGFFWFQNGNDFVRSAKKMIRKDAHVDNTFYICPAFNELVLEQKRIGIHTIDGKNYHPLKNLHQIERFETIVDR